MEPGNYLSHTMSKNNGNKYTRRDFLKGAAVFGGALLLGGYGVRRVSQTISRDYDSERSKEFLDRIPPAKDMDQLPNIVIIFTDDLGYGDISINGSQAILTPNLDKMASEGVLLTSFYSTAPLCSPARAGLLTGRYPIRTMVTGSLYPRGSPMNLLMDVAGFYTNGVRGIPEDELLLPEILQRRGYQTALLGKWHLGDHSPYLPNENGFDYFYGALYSNDMHPYRIYRNNKVIHDVPIDQDNITREITKEAVSFIQMNGNDPFFLYIAHPMPHEPIHASEAYRGSSNAGLYGDSVEEIDWSVGQIIKTLQDSGLDEKTLVVFTSDNGPWWQGNPGFSRGRKNLPFEGGYRVPFIARWPGKLPGGFKCDEMSMNFDLYATILPLIGVELPKDRIIDGRDILPMLQGESGSPHDTLFFFKGRNLYGVRNRDWKYLRRHMTDNGGYTTLSQGPFLFTFR